MSQIPKKISVPTESFYYENNKKQNAKSFCRKLDSKQKKEDLEIIQKKMEALKPNPFDLYPLSKCEVEMEKKEAQPPADECAQKESLKNINHDEEDPFFEILANLGQIGAYKPLSHPKFSMKDLRVKKKKESFEERFMSKGSIFDKDLVSEYYAFNQGSLTKTKNI